ncbi:MAG: PHP domain-containing protein [Candidatus Omnitrophica bacterium]|nr:PHP domain-containing protein [Candidatus Omnitrophota bacterium]
MRKRKIDLHVHTYYSDGTFSPEKVISEAKKRGLSAVAICDHDCVEGIEEAKKAGAKHGVEVIPGVEVTCEKDGLEIHMLGYFIDIESRPIIDLITVLRDKRIKRIYDMVDRLKNYNVNISPHKVFALSPKGAVSRMHLASAIYNEGFVSSIKEAFAKYIGDKAPCYVSRFEVSPESAIDAILKSKGVPVYAHPNVMGRDDLIPGFAKAGLRGIEVYHSEHNRWTEEHYLNVAHKFGLLVTGGSDCHGAGKGRILMGGVTMPYSTLEDLKREAEDVRKNQDA